MLQLLPMLGCVRSKFTDNECLELYTNKLFRLTSEETQRLAYSYRDILIIQENKHVLAHQAMLSILQIKNIMNMVRIRLSSLCSQKPVLCHLNLFQNFTPYFFLIFPIGAQVPDVSRGAFYIS